MTQTDTAVLFAGQGKLAATGFTCSEQVKPYLEDICSEIDEVSLQRSGILVSDLVRSIGSEAVEPESLCSGALRLAIFGASVAAYRTLIHTGAAPSVLLGHGLGEVTALVCAGSLSVAQGARIICERHALLKAIDRTIGCMGVLKTDGFHARKLIGYLHSDFVCVAAENSPAETVIAGRTREMRQTMTLAAKHGIACRTLVSPYALHCWALMHEASQALATAIGNMSARAPKVLVFSSWLGRYYRSEDPIPSLLASHVARPFRFADAIWQLYRGGVTTYVECGPLSGISRHVESTIGRYTAPVIAHADLMTSSADGQTVIPPRPLPLARAASSSGAAAIRAATVH